MHVCKQWDCGETDGFRGMAALHGLGEEALTFTRLLLAVVGIMSGKERFTPAVKRNEESLASGDL